jgi:chromosome condensin MukBEF ATPase and DNA-binding subunit MukB
MRTAKRARFRRIFLVNWLDLPYAQIDLDDNITIFEGGNGSGKTSIMLAALATLMPDKKQLRNRKVSIEKHAVEAIFYRLQPDEPISYAALEIETKAGFFLAGVHITKQKESASIELEPFTISNWVPRESVQDFFRCSAQDKEWTCSFSEIKQRAGEWNVYLQPHQTLATYFKALYDIGALPLAMATEAERSQYAHLLETSMVGGLSAALAAKLKDYLLPESEKLPATVKLMHDNLRACIETQLELKDSEQHYKRIAGLFNSLTDYVTTLLTKVGREIDAVHAALRLTEQNLQNTQKDLANLAEEREKLIKKKDILAARKNTALSELNTLIHKHTIQEQEFTSEVARADESLAEAQKQLGPINASFIELEQAVNRFQKLFEVSIPEPSAKIVESKIKSELSKSEDETRSLTDQIDALEKERDELRNRSGITAELSSLAEKLNGTCVRKRYADMENLGEAGKIEAKLGPIVGGIIVKDIDQAVKQIGKIDADTCELWLTSAEDPANSFPSRSHSHFQEVNHGFATRLTQIPQFPSIGEAARKNRIKYLDQQIEQSRKAIKELEPVTKELDEMIKHVHRVSDEYESRPLSWLKSNIVSLNAEIDRLKKKRAVAADKATQARAEVAAAHNRQLEIYQEFKLPEDEIVSELTRNEHAIAIKEPLKQKLELERERGIEKHTANKKVWEQISHLQEPQQQNEVAAVDAGGSLERLRQSLSQIPNHEQASKNLPEIIGEDFFAPALELPKVRKAVLDLIRTIQPHNLTESADPQTVIEALTKKINALSGRFDEQQKSFRANIDTIANSIHSEIRNRTHRMLRWSNDLRAVRFGTVNGIQLKLQKIDSEIDVLDSLRQQQEFFSDPKLDPKTALQQFWKRRTGQELTAQNALDYRRFVNLTIEVGDGRGKWRPVGGSTGEMVGAALAVLIILLRAWEEEAVLRDSVDPLRLLFLDEAARLDEPSHATLEALSNNMSIQFIVAAPIVAASGKYTHYVLSRKEVGNSRRVFIRGRRRFCDPENTSSSP